MPLSDIQTLAGRPTIQLRSHTMYLETALDPTGEGLGAAGPSPWPHTSDASHKPRSASVFLGGCL